MAALQDTGQEDAAIQDTGQEDAAIQDTGQEDTAIQDTGQEDIAIQDTGQEDAAIQDTGQEDIAIQDTGQEDAAIQDTGQEDIAIQDTGQEDAAQLVVAQQDTNQQNRTQRSTSICLRFLVSAGNYLLSCWKDSDTEKLKKYLTRGDECSAMHLFFNSPDLQTSINPNVSYGKRYNHDTPLHCTGQYGMQHLLRAFLFEHGGNPNQRNGSKQTCLHATCTIKTNKSFPEVDRKSACLMNILQWKGDTLESGEREEIDVVAQDKNGNTALHLAASVGLTCCVEILIGAGCPIHLRNLQKLTACDMAARNGHKCIAEILEGRVVFEHLIDLRCDHELSENLSEEEVYVALSIEDLHKAKDELLVETSNMLNVPLFTAEALLRNNEWSRQMLMDNWLGDAVKCCRLAGVEPPPSAFKENYDPFEMSDMFSDIPPKPQNDICDICLMEMKEDDQPSIRIPCNHNFCFQCWETYLSNKIIEGMQHNIPCPAYECNTLIPVQVIENLVGPEVVERYLILDIQAFVEANRFMKWCPAPGCSRAVRIPEPELLRDELHAVNDRAAERISIAVDCGNGHFFCWDCLGEAHAPSGCGEWRQWLERVSKLKPDQARNSVRFFDDASNILWIVSNSKPCPRCDCPIQKNEGCNHMKCVRCKHDFCWLCMDTWKRHSPFTGGYFHCSRTLAIARAKERRRGLINRAVTRKQQAQELNRFMYYYNKYNGNDLSRKTEQGFLQTVVSKMQVLEATLRNRKLESFCAREIMSENEKSLTQFLEDGIRELLKARRVLCGSYVYAYYSKDSGQIKSIFEFMQNELEAATTLLSDMIARPYLSNPRHVIIETIALVRRKRIEFVRAILRGLIPADTTPVVKVEQKLPGNLPTNQNYDDEFSKLMISSLMKSFDESDPSMNPYRRHNNPDGNEGPEEEVEVRRTGPLSLTKKCIRKGCNRPQLREPPTMIELQSLCSLCSRNAMKTQNPAEEKSMNLAIPFETSKMQMMEDRGQSGNQPVNEPTKSNSSTQTNSDANLNLAMALPMDLNLAMALPMGRQKTDVGVTSQDRCLIYEEVPIEMNPNFNRYHLESKPSGHRTEKLEDRIKKRLSFYKAMHETEDDKIGLLSFEETSADSTVCGGSCNQRPIHGITGVESFKAEVGGSSKLYTQKMNSKTANPTGGSSSKSLRIDVPKLTVSYNHGEQCTRKNLPNKSASSVLSLPLRKVPSKENIRMEGSGDKQSVRNLREDQIGVKSMGNERRRSPLHGHKGFSSRNRPDGQNSHFEFGDTGVEFLRHCPERGCSGKIKSADYVFPIGPNSGALSSTAVEKLKETKKLLAYKEKSSKGAHERAFKDAGGKIPSWKDSRFDSKESTVKSNSNLKVRIGKSPDGTDSSNEYETDTGIPKFRTLNISGVSISRTWERATSLMKRDGKSPEPKTPKFPSPLKDPSRRGVYGKDNNSPMLSFISPSIDFNSRYEKGFRGAEENVFLPEKVDEKFSNFCCCQGHPASFPAFRPIGLKESGNRSLNYSWSAIPTCHNERKSRSRIDERQIFGFSPTHSVIGSGWHEISMGNEIPFVNSKGVFIFPGSGQMQGDFKPMENYLQEPNRNSFAEEVRKTGKSKPASEPKRERKMLPIPKSFTDGALSSVVHVHESSQSSDEFHEGLFLFGGSPKCRSKRLKTRKERNKLKENSNKVEFSSFP